MALIDWLFPAADAERFARRVSRTLRHAGLADRMRVMFHGKQRSGPTNGAHVLNLENLYLDYRNLSRGQRGQVFDRIVQIVRRSGEEGGGSLADVRDRLLPLVRDALFFSQLDPLGPRADGKRSVERPMNDELSCGLCVDYDEAITSVNGDALARFGVSEDEAYRIARENLERRGDAPFAEAVPGLFVSNFRDYHDAARLAMPQLFARLNVRGDVVVAVPNRTLVLATGSNDPDNLARLCAIAEEQITTQPRPMSGALFRLENFEWRPWLPPRSSPAFATARRLAIIGRANQYAGQHDALTAALAKAGIDRFVAKQDVRSGADGFLFTWCAWPPGVSDGSMPESDLVTMGDPRTASVARWGDVMRVSGHRLSRDPCGRPARWLFTTTPSAEEMAAMPATDIDVALARLRAATGGVE